MPRRYCLYLCFLAFSALAERAPAAVPLSESEFLSRATAQPGVAALLDGPVLAATAEAQRASIWANPVAEVEGESPGEERRQTTWSLSWQAPLDPRRGPLRAAARASVDAAVGERAWSALELRAELRGTYADWALAVERAAASTDLLDRVRKLVAAWSERARSGEESGLALRRLQLASVELEAQAGNAFAELARTAAAARAWIGGADEYEPRLPPLPDPVDPGSSIEHPALAARQSDVEAAQHRARASHRFLSFPEIFVGLRQVREPGFEEDGLTLGGRLALPLFDRQQADRAEAKARLASARAHLELDTARMNARRAAAEEAYRRLREAAVSSRAVIEQSDAVIESATARFQMGEGDLTELLETLRGVLASRSASLDLYGSALEAHRELELAAGQPLEEEKR